MNKKDSAANFFLQMAGDEGQFITRLIQEEMDSDVITLFNQFGRQIKLEGLNPESSQSTLMIIGYLVRAFEERHKGEKQPLKYPNESDKDDGAIH